MNRRQFVFASLAAAGAAARRSAAAPLLEFGHRQANMEVPPGPGVFDLGKQIGLNGVELQVFFKGTTLWDKDTLAGYKSASERTGLPVPSVAGIWPPGAGLPQPTAEEHIRKSIQVAEALHAKTILIACFDANCPKMDEEKSYGPVVTLLAKVAGQAQDAGVVLAMETSNSPPEDKKLIDLVNRPSVRVYYDLFNVEHYKHTNEAVPGIAVLKNRIRQVHLKNEDKLLDERGPVDWAAAVKGLAAIDYRGWFVFETAHHSQQEVVEATQKNIRFVRDHFAA
ncbi:MAG TPA: sugar phosphate isomerase/epimerase family protein [Bryobacteraceae bacterium]|nr:sugar phosphate isomerase/epimerase family protein [Bryobacteraceae bacterium]